MVVSFQRAAPNPRTVQPRIRIRTTTAATWLALVSVMWLAHIADSPVRGQALSRPQQRSAAFTRAEDRDLFPYFAYVAAGGRQDILIGARAWGIAPDTYLDAVCSDLVAHGFNVIWLNNLDFDWLPNWLSAARRHGLRVVAQGSGRAAFFPADGDWDSGRLNAEETKAFYREVGERYRNDPTLLMYVVTEEIPARVPLFAQLADIVAGATEADPFHPAIAEYNSVDSVRMAATTLRPPVIVFGVGPFPNDGSTDDDTRYFFPLFTEQSSVASRSIGAPLWVLTQGNDFDIYQDGVLQRTAARRPTRAQLRWEVWSALLHGAKGIGYFLYTWPHELSGVGYEEDLHGLVTRAGRPTEIYEEAAAVSRSLDPIKSLLLRLDPASELANDNPYWNTAEVVRARLFLDRQTGERYLMLVNYDFAQSRPARLPMEVIVGVARLQDLRSGHVWTPGSLAGLTLAPGDGTLLRLTP